MAAAATAGLGPLPLPTPDPGPYGVYNVAGPMLAGGFGQMTLLGLLFAQTQSFFEESNDGLAIKSLVVFVNLVALAQGCFTFENWWRAFVQKFGTLATNLEFADEMQPVMTALMSVPVHAYFVSRCYQATGKSKAVLAVLTSFILTTLVAGIFVSVGLVSAHQGVDSEAGPPPVNVAVVILLVISAVLDVLITAILLSFLIRSRGKGCSQYLHGLIDNLITLVWSCAAPPCVCATAACIAYLVSYGQGSPTLWAYLPGDLLGLLYGLALLVTLNSRPEAERMRRPAFDCDETMPGPGQILNCPLAKNMLIRIEAGRSADIVGVDIAHVVGEVDSLGSTSRPSSLYERPIGADSRPSVTVFGKPKRELA